MTEEMSVEDTMNAMMAGTHTDPEDVVDEELDTNEDTDQDTELEEEADTEQEIDDELEDTEELEDEVEEEDTPVDEDSEPEEEEEPVTEEVIEEPIEAVEEVDTEEKPAEEVPETTNEIDYKEFYEKVANAKFKANGKEVEGFKNPEDLIRAQQMLHGYSDKMKVVKDYKKFMKPLQDQGMLQDPNKFNLAMSAISGDVEAIKKLVVDNKIDPLDIDGDNINYKATDYRATDEQISIDETFEKAAVLGVKDRLYDVLEKDWDDESKNVFITDPAVRSDLVTHISDGSYDLVMSKINSIELTDVDGKFSSRSFVDKYKAAANVLTQEYNARQEATKVATPPIVKEVVQPVKEVTPSKEEIYKKKVAEKKVAEQRKKAASVSKKKSVAKPKKKVNPESLKGDEFRDYFNKMLMS